MKEIDVYGIGNPLMDVLLDITDKELIELGLPKGVMNLIDDEKRDKIVSFIGDKDTTFKCGGACPNTIITLANLGLTTALTGKIGEDDFGAIYDDQIKNHKVITQLKKGKGSTGSSIIMISPDAERTMNTHLGMCQHLCDEDIDYDSIKNSKYVYFTGYMWDTEKQKNAMVGALITAKENDTKVIFDVADPFVVKRNKDEFLELIKENVNIVFANEDEAKMLFDTDDPRLALTKLSEITDMAIVKIGSKGSLIKEKDKNIIEIPVNKVEAIDTTGAGDTYAAGFIYGLCKEMDLKDTGIFASFLASHIVTQKGAQFPKDNMDKINDHVTNSSWKFTN